MYLIQRYRRLTLWNKLGALGALASIIGLLLTLAGSPSISQQTHGHLSPAIANNSGSIIIASTPAALKKPLWASTRDTSVWTQSHFFVRNINMPRGFTTRRHAGLTSNSFGQRENCYYCTSAALLGITTNELVGVAEIMTQDKATKEEILELMAAAGIPGPSYVQFDRPPWVVEELNMLPNGQALGLAYTRVDGTGHMIVVCKNHFGDLRFIDYQNSPPTHRLPPQIICLGAIGQRPEPSPRRPQWTRR